MISVPWGRYKELGADPGRVAQAVTQGRLGKGVPRGHGFRIQAHRGSWVSPGLTPLFQGLPSSSYHPPNSTPGSHSDWLSLMQEPSGKTSFFSLYLNTERWKLPLQDKILLENRTNTERKWIQEMEKENLGVEDWTWIKLNLELNLSPDSQVIWVNQFCCS